MANHCGLPLLSASGVQSPGHEGAGVVVKVGANVKEWKLGDRGGVKPIWNTCGSCDSCKEGKENYCMNLINTGLHVNGAVLRHNSCGEKANNF